MTIPNWAWKLAQWWWGLGPYRGHARDQHVRPAAPKPAPKWFVTWVQRFKPKPKPRPLSWQGRGVFAVESDQGGMDAAALVGRLAGHAHYVLCQYDPKDVERLQAIKTQCVTAGVSFRIWDALPSADRLEGIGALEPEGVCLQAEQADQPSIYALLSVMDAARKMWPKPFPLSIVTNLGPSRTVIPFDEDAIELDFAFLVECYVPENPNATVAGMTWDATRRGHREVVPVVECRGDYGLSNYQPLSASYAVWAETTMRAADWLLL